MILLFILKVFPCNSKVIKPFDLFNLLEQLENLLMIYLNPCILTLWQSKKGKEKLVRLENQGERWATENLKKKSLVVEGPRWD